MTIKRRDFVKGLGALGFSVPVIAKATAGELTVHKGQRQLEGVVSAKEPEYEITRDPALTDDLHLKEEAKVASPKGFLQPDHELIKILKDSGSLKRDVYEKAIKIIADAVQVPLNKTVSESQIFDIFNRHIYIPEGPNSHTHCVFSEVEDRAYAPANHGCSADRYGGEKGDHVCVPVYEIWSALDWRSSYARDARWDILVDGLQQFAQSFITKIHDDSFHTLAAAAVDRNMTVIDEKHNKGWSPRLLSTMKVIMRRNGNKRLTHLYINPDAMEPWGIKTYGEEDWLNIRCSGGLRVYNVEIRFTHLDFSQYILDELLQVRELGDNNKGFCLGLDQSEYEKDGKLVYPFHIVQPITRREVYVNPDYDIHRQGRAGLYGVGTQGIVVLDNRCTLLGEYKNVEA
jgi:hypothetical protein